MKKLLQNPLVKNIVSALAVAIFGVILLSLTFIFDFIFQSTIRALGRRFLPVDPSTAPYWLPPVLHAAFVVIIGLLSWLVFRSKLPVLYKAIYMTVPVAVVLATVGMSLYQWPIVTYAVGSVLCIGTVYSFRRTKQPWLYTYTVILVGVAMALFTLTGGEI